MSCFKKLCISDVSAPLKGCAFTLLVLDNIHPFMSLIIESLAIRRISGFDSFALLSLESFPQQLCCTFCRMFLLFFFVAVSPCCFCLILLITSLPLLTSFCNFFLRSVFSFSNFWSLCFNSWFSLLKPSLHIVGRIAGMCLRPCPKEYIIALHVSIAKISCERLLSSKACIMMW